MAKFQSNCTPLKLNINHSAYYITLFICFLLANIIEHNHSLVNGMVINQPHFPSDESTDTEETDPYPEDVHGEPKCRTMRIPLCEKVGYNRTYLPNSLHHTTQSEVVSDINVYSVLVKTECSPNIRLFLCSFYAPMCFDNIDGSKPMILSPCRSLCEAVKRDCQSQFDKSSQSWPQYLRCEQFPESKNKCVSLENDSKFSPNFNDHSKNNHYSSSNNGVTRDLNFVCPRNFEVPGHSLYLKGKNYSNCGKPCEGVILDNNHERLVSNVLLGIAILSLMSTLFTCSYYIRYPERFNYPLKPIVIIAACQLILAVCYLIGIFSGNEIACKQPVDPPKSLPNLKMIRSVNQGHKEDSCTLIFMGIYFFQMSQHFWWLMLTISWYLIAHWKWAPEAVNGISKYFHSVSWVVPGVMTVYLIAIGSIEGDPLSGTCYIKPSDYQTIRALVIVPILICFAISAVLLILGYKSLWEAHEILKREFGKQTADHNKLIARITIFSAFFLSLSMLLIWYLQQEIAELDSWMISWLSRICESNSMPCPMKSDDITKRATPLHVIMKHFSIMGIGVFSAVFAIPWNLKSS